MGTLFSAEHLGRPFATMNPVQRLFLDERLQANQCFVPLLRHDVEVFSNFIERLCFEREAALPAPSHPAHNTCPLQNAEVLCNRLARHFGPLRQLGNRLWSSMTELGDERKSRLVAERGKDGRMSLPFGS